MKQGKTLKSGRGGMTLVEVMIATLLVSFGLASFLTAFMAASRATEASIRRVRALHTARQVMEDVRSRSYGAVATGTNTYAAGVSCAVSLAPGFAATKNIRVAVDWVNPGSSEPCQVVLWNSIASCIHP